MIYLVLFLFFFSIFIKSLLIFWRVFLILTIIFIFLIKLEGNQLSLLNYFILQEILGLIFIFLNIIFFQSIFIIIKLGVSPFHFWIFSILNSLSLNLIYWFLTFQKIVYLIVLINFKIMFFFLIFGILVCFFQVLFIYDYLKIFLVNLTERMSWLLMLFRLRILDSLLLAIYYLFLLIFFIKKRLSKKNKNWFLIFFFLNVPLRFNFFLKIFFLSHFSKRFFLVFFFLLFIIILRFLGFIKILINRRLGFNYLKLLNRQKYVLILQFLILFYCFSKIILYYLDKIKLKIIFWVFYYK